MKGRDECKMGNDQTEVTGKFWMSRPSETQLLPLSQNLSLLKI